MLKTINHALKRRRPHTWCNSSHKSLVTQLKQYHVTVKLYNSSDSKEVSNDGISGQEAEVFEKDGKRFGLKFKYHPPFEWRAVYYELASKSEPTKQFILRNPKKVITFVLLVGLVMVVISLWDILSPTSTIADLMPQFIKSILRVVRSFVTIGLIVFDYKYTLWGVTDEEERRKLTKSAHKKSAERILNLCLANGGVFIKAGQHIASLNQILPPEYTTTLQPCQDRALTRPWSEIEKFFIKELGHGVNYFFQYFDPNPIAAASLAQVYKARLHDGTLVAVKVQYPNLEEQVKHDTKTFSQLIGVVEYFFPSVKLKWLLEEFERTIPHELNFIEEGRNSEKLSNLLKKNFKDSVVCPKVFWESTSSRILTQEFVEGVKINNRVGISQLQVDAAQVAKLLTEAYCEQIFIHGFVHSDPHSGNVLVRRNPNSWTSPFQIVILDHGLYHDVEPEFRSDYAHLWKAIVERDEHSIKTHAKKIGINDYELFTVMLTARRFDMKDVGMRNDMTEEQARTLRKYGQDNFDTITQVLSDVNRKALLLLKCNDLLRSVQMDLGIPVNYFLTFAKYATMGINKMRMESPNANIFTRISCFKDYAMLTVKLTLYPYLIMLRNIWERFLSSLSRREVPLSTSEQ